jgi:hypothetical protein
MGRALLFLLINLAFTYWFIRRVSQRTAFHYRRQPPITFYARIQQVIDASAEEDDLEDRIRFELRIGLAERDIEPKDFDIQLRHDEVSGLTVDVVQVTSGRVWSLSGFDVYLREEHSAGQTL